jgi:hypothetical protein
MTLIISTMTSEGIVMTADSRQTYKNNVGAVRVGSDTAMKIFTLTKKVAVSISGRAFINEGSGDKNVGFYIKRFARETELQNKSVRQIAEELDTYLTGLFVEREITILRSQIESVVAKEQGTNLQIAERSGHQLPYSFTASQGDVQTRTGEVSTIYMIVAGIDMDNVGRAYSVTVSKGVVVERDTNSCGALWLGQTDVLARVIKGYAPEISIVSFVKDAIEVNAATAQTELGKLEYIINWGTMTIQDAVDFGVLMTKTTENIQRFSDGFAGSPGGITGVGGAIDIVVITPESGAQWLSKKSIKYNDKEINLDKHVDPTPSDSGAEDGAEITEEVR